MKLYLVTRKGEISYDEYAGAVIAANSAEDAERDMDTLQREGEFGGYYRAEWVVTLIAEETHPDVKLGVVIEDYRAG